VVGSEKGVGTIDRKKKEEEANQIPEAEVSEKVSATAAIAATSRNMRRSEDLIGRGGCFRNAGEV
jgi:hypothetical protein